MEKLPAVHFWNMAKKKPLYFEMEIHRATIPKLLEAKRFISF